MWLFGKQSPVSVLFLCLSFLFISGCGSDTRTQNSADRFVDLDPVFDEPVYEVSEEEAPFNCDTELCYWEYNGFSYVNQAERLINTPELVSWRVTSNELANFTETSSLLLEIEYLPDDTILVRSSYYRSAAHDPDLIDIEPLMSETLFETHNPELEDWPQDPFGRPEPLPIAAVHTLAADAASNIMFVPLRTRESWGDGKCSGPAKKVEKVAHHCCLKHDDCYCLKGYTPEGQKSRRECDVDFRECLKKAGVSWWTRTKLYVGLRVGGWASWGGPGTN